MTSTLPERPVYAERPTADEWVYILARVPAVQQALKELREFRQ